MGDLNRTYHADHESSVETDSEIESNTSRTFIATSQSCADVEANGGSVFSNQIVQIVYHEPSPVIAKLILHIPHVH